MMAREIESLGRGYYRVHGAIVEKQVGQVWPASASHRSRRRKVSWKVDKIGHTEVSYTFPTLREAREALRPRPGKLGTHSSAVYQVLGEVALGSRVMIRSDMDYRCEQWWIPARVWKIGDDGFLFLECA